MVVAPSVGRGEGDITSSQPHLTSDMPCWAWVTWCSRVFCSHSRYDSIPSCAGDRSAGELATGAQAVSLHSLIPYPGIRTCTSPCISNRAFLPAYLLSMPRTAAIYTGPASQIREFATRNVTTPLTGMLYGRVAGTRPCYGLGTAQGCFSPKWRTTR